MSQTTDAPGESQGQDAGATLLTGGLTQEAGMDPAAPGADTAPPDKADAAEEKKDGPDKEAPDKEADPLAQVPESPDGYALAFDKSVSVDTALLSSFQATAFDLGINRGQAQKLADLYAGHVADTMRSQAETLRQAVAGWESEIKDSPGFAAGKADAQRALAQYGSPELFQVMDETLIGSHPAMFRFMAAVGKALAEPEFKGKGAAGSAMTAEKILYPDMK